MKEDNWKDKTSFRCGTCMYYVQKDGTLGRCRYNPPVVVSGWPAVYDGDFCGQHKIDPEKLNE